MNKYEVTVRTLSGQMKTIIVEAHETAGAISIVRRNYDVRVVDCRLIA